MADSVRLGVPSKLAVESSPSTRVHEFTDIRLKEAMLLPMEREAGAAIASLSGRERQLLEMATEGLTDHGIAHALGISFGTVGTYWGRVRMKLGPYNRTELVAIFLRDQSRAELEKLKVDNEALVQALRQRAQALEKIQASLDLFRGILESAPDAIFIVSEDGSILLANDRAEEMFGYCKDEMIGSSIDLLVPERFQAVHPAKRAEYAKNPVKRPMSEHLATFGRKKSGALFPMATALSSSSSESGMLITCIVRDLTGMLSK